MSDLVAALLDAAWSMAARGCDKHMIAEACGIDRATAQDVITRYGHYRHQVSIGIKRHEPVHVG